MSNDYNPYAGIHINGHNHPRHQYNESDSYDGSDHQQITYHTANPPSYYTQSGIRHNKQSNVTVLVYDIIHELIWSGTSNGWITCNYHNTLNHARIRFNVNTIVSHSQNHHITQSIVAICTHIQNITIVTSTCILYCTRGGLVNNIYSINTNNSDIQTIRCAVQPDYNTPVIYYITNKNEWYVYDIINNTSCNINVNVESTALYQCMIAERNMIISGRTDGYIESRDIRQSCKYTAMYKQAHPGTVSDMDINDNSLVTCGMATVCSDRYDRARYDSLIKLFDIRSKSMVHPIQLNNNSGCSRLKYIKTLSNTIVAINTMGMFELIDINMNHIYNNNNNTASTAVKQVYYSKLSDHSTIDQLCVSSSGQCITFADSYGLIQTWSTHHTPVANTYSQSIDYVQPIHTENTTGFMFDESTPLSYVPAVGYNNDHKLLSNVLQWPNTHCYNYIPPIDTSLINELKYNDFIGIASNPNPSLYKPNSAVTVQKFSAQLYNNIDSSTIHTNSVCIIPLYARVTIKIPKLGLYAYDFSQYNHSPYTGLDNLLPNSYVNSALQCIYFISRIKQQCIAHICFNEYCLTCELGLLYHMLDTSKKPNTIEPRNLLHTLKYLPECNALNLLDNTYQFNQGKNKLILSNKIQDFIRFMLEQLYKECVVYNHNTINIINESFCIHIVKQQICQAKHHITNTSTTLHTIKLIYPQTRQNKSFVDILQQSVCSTIIRRNKCIQCNTHELIQYNQLVKQLPQYLNISANVANDIQIDLWRVSDGHDEYWLPVYISVVLDNNTNTVFIHRLTADQINDTYDDNTVLYELYSVISHIIDPSSTNTALNQHHGEHLVAHIHTDNNQWYCFNDFVINESSALEATNFTYTYKLPSQLMYQRIDKVYQNKLMSTTANNNNNNSKSVYYDLIYHEFHSLSPYTQHNKLQFTRLSPDEQLDHNTLLAIDCEFVEVQHAITENTIIVRPARLALARVSVVRGNSGVPLIDDYIIETEPIVDYLTQYSGIHLGDLSAEHSTYHLQSIKQVSIKLRSLIDHQCKFIGHGLKNDFLMINVYVPAEQIIDTVELYYIESYRRRLNLRYLAKHVLNINVQENEHDSIVDANTARLLYIKYCEWKSNGMNYVHDKLIELYQIGMVSGFKV